MNVMAEAVKGLGYMLAFLNIGLTIATIALPDWRVNDVEGEVVELIKRTQGLWTKCAFFPTGNWQCEDYDRFFIALPAAITGARVFSCFSLIFQLGIIVCLPFGMMCTNIPFGEGANRTKGKITICCGALSILSAVCLGIAVSWYAALVVEDYNRDFMGMSQGVETSVQRFIYGKALYIGWISMALQVIQGAILCCSSWGETDFEGYQAATNYGNAPYDPYQSTKYSGVGTGAPKYGHSDMHEAPANQNYI